jgi:hypothetical protein
LRLKTEKKMHKEEMYYRDRKHVALVVLFCACIVYAVVVIRVRVLCEKMCSQVALYLLFRYDS